jgi:hypothetical protein
MECGRHFVGHALMARSAIGPPAGLFLRVARETAKKWRNTRSTIGCIEPVYRVIASERRTGLRQPVCNPYRSMESSGIARLPDQRLHLSDDLLRSFLYGRILKGDDVRFLRPFATTGLLRHRRSG